MDTKNSEKFIDAFVTIEMYLKDYLGSPNVGFSQMVHMAAPKHPVIGTYKNELTEFGQLRNAIVHNRAGKNEAIAEPHDSVIETMALIIQALESPRRVRDVFSMNRVFVAEGTESFSEILKIQREQNYSAVPVYRDNRYVGLLHTRLYQMFLEQNADATLDLKQYTVNDILKYYEKDSRVIFVSGETTLYDVLKIFNRMHEKGQSMIAMIITEQGFVNEKPIGIITVADVPKILSELE
ncbi:CBS domain-containing protein [Erysipelothrix aquatica]|uniref:CBS domain-containing protein n=1 Tax=Erysipelothrix aquatica TaxID=2683714 RepID=UPI00135B494F|nr:CBS domain-containing protein [Erysipelothrix aquatica]